MTTQTKKKVTDSSTVAFRSYPELAIRVGQALKPKRRTLADSLTGNPIVDAWTTAFYVDQTTFQDLLDLQESAHKYSDCMDPYPYFVDFVVLANQLRMKYRVTEGKEIPELDELASLFTSVWYCACYQGNAGVMEVEEKLFPTIRALRPILRSFGYSMDANWDSSEYTIGDLKADMAAAKESCLDDTLVYYAYLAAAWIWTNYIDLNDGTMEWPGEGWVRNEYDGKILWQPAEDDLEDETAEEGVC